MLPATSVYARMCVSVCVFAGVEIVRCEVHILGCILDRLVESTRNCCSLSSEVVLYVKDSASGLYAR